MQIEALKREKRPDAPHVPAVAPAIRDISASLPRHELLRWDSRTLASITQVAIHHSAVPANVPAEEVARYYVSRNTPGITYHYYIIPDGTIFQTNRLETACTHLHAGNEAAVGVCIAGNFDDVSPTPRQIGAAASLVAWLCQKLNIPNERVLGHADFSGATGTCPGRQWAAGQQWQQAFRTRLQQAQALGATPERAIGHYLLFWQRSDRWARDEWLGAMNYIARFRPTAGFSLDDAQHSEYVTIVGGLDGVTWDCEQMLLSAGCKVERIAGANPAATQQILDQMAQDGKRFRDFGQW